MQYEERESDLGVLAKAKDSELAGLHSQMEEMQKRVREVFTENVELKREVGRAYGKGQTVQIGIKVSLRLKSLIKWQLSSSLG